MSWVPDFVQWLQGLSIVPKALASAVVMAVATMIVAVLWQKPVVAANPGQSLSTGTLWPDDHSLQGLIRRLSRTSKTNIEFLQAVDAGGDDGIYVDQLAKKLSLSRSEVIYRAKELEALKLIEILQLTDDNYRIHDDVHAALGPNGGRFLRALLQ